MKFGDKVKVIDKYDMNYGAVGHIASRPEECLWLGVEPYVFVNVQFKWVSVPYDLRQLQLLKDLDVPFLTNRRGTKGAGKKTILLENHHIEIKKSVGYWAYLVTCADLKLHANVAVNGAIRGSGVNKYRSLIKDAIRAFELPAQEAEGMRLL